MSTPLRTIADRLIALPPLLLAAGFTVADLAAGWLHGLYAHGHLPHRFFNLSRDRGLAETIQYAKFGVIILLLSRWRRAQPSRLVTAWIVLFAVMLLDDAIGIHEAVGDWILSVIPIAATELVRAKDLAEAMVFAALEGSVCLYVALRYFQAPAGQRGFSWAFALALIPLVTSGLVLDELPFYMAEQIGEMASMTLLLVTVHWQYRLHAAAVEASECDQTAPFHAR